MAVYGMAMLLTACAQQPVVAPTGSIAQSTASVPLVSGAPPNTLEVLATRAGMKTACQDAIKSLGSAFTGPAGAHAALPMNQSVAADKSMFSAVIERQDADGMHLVSSWFAPTARNRCDVGREVLTTWKKSCEEVAVQDLQMKKPLSVVGRDVIVAVVTPVHHIYLIRTEGGCVSLNKELIYQ